VNEKFFGLGRAAPDWPHAWEFRQVLRSKLIKLIKKCAKVALQSCVAYFRAHLLSGNEVNLLKAGKQSLNVWPSGPF